MIHFIFVEPVESEDESFIYRIETDDQSGNLTGVIEYCSELGGYPIYANNAYEWHLIQGSFLLSSSLTDVYSLIEIMLKDPNFNLDYVYTGLISPRKDPSNSFWLPRNISVKFL